MMKEKSHLLFGQMLVEDGVITATQLEEALAVQAKMRQEGGEVKRIGVILKNLGYIEKPMIEEYVNRIMKSYY